MNYTRDELEQFYNTTKQAYLDAVKALEYEIGDKELRRERVNVLRREMEMWKGRLDDLINNRRKGIRIGRITPL